MTLDEEFDEILANGRAALSRTEPPRVHLPQLIPTTKDSA